MFESEPAAGASAVTIGPSEGRGRGVFMTCDEKAGSAVSCEAPFVAMAPHAQVCACCGRITGSLLQQLNAQTAVLRRSTGLACPPCAGPLPALPGSPPERAESACECACGQQYCNWSCRAQDEPLHSLLCAGRQGSDAPEGVEVEDDDLAAEWQFAGALAEMLEETSFSGDHSPCLPLAVRAVAGLVAFGLQPEGSFGAALARLERATGPLATGALVEAGAAPSAGDPGAGGGGTEEESDDGEEGDGGEEGSDEEGDEGGEEEAGADEEDGDEAEALLSQVYSATWQLLTSLFLLRVPGTRAGRSLLSELSALGPRWFDSLCRAVERCAIPVLLPIPLQRYVDSLVGAPKETQTEVARAIGPVAALALASLAQDPPGGGDRPRKKVRTTATGSSSAAQRPAGAPPRPLSLKQLMHALRNASELFPPLVGMALPPIACVVNHSCAPNCTVRFSGLINPAETDAGSSEDAATPAARLAASAGWAQCRLVLDRPVAAGEELEMSYVDGGMPLSERRAGLRAVHGFVCCCPRFTLTLTLTLTPTLLVTLT